MVLWTILGILATLSALVIAASVATVTYYRVVADPPESEAVQTAKLEAYEEIMAAVVKLNRTAVDVGEKRFHQEADKLLMDEESVLEDPHTEVTQTYQRYYYLLDRDVYEAATDYVDYLVEYHEEGATVAELLTRGGEVGAAMRAELGHAPLGDRPPGEEGEGP